MLDCWSCWTRARRSGRVVFSASRAAAGRMEVRALLSWFIKRVVPAKESDGAADRIPRYVDDKRAKAIKQAALFEESHGRERRSSMPSLRSGNDARAGAFRVSILGMHRVSGLQGDEESIVAGPIAFFEALQGHFDRFWIPGCAAPHYRTA